MEAATITLDDVYSQYQQFSAAHSLSEDLDCPEQSNVSDKRIEITCSGQIKRDDGIGLCIQMRANQDVKVRELTLDIERSKLDYEAHKKLVYGTDPKAY